MKMKIKQKPKEHQQNVKVVEKVENKVQMDVETLEQAAKKEVEQAVEDEMEQAVEEEVEQAAEEKDQPQLSSQNDAEEPAIQTDVPSLQQHPQMGDTEYNQGCYPQCLANRAVLSP